MLNTLHGKSVDGDEKSMKKLGIMFKQFLPEEMKAGRYRILGGLLLRMNESMAYFSDRYTANKHVKKRLANHSLDIIETVSHILGHMSGEQKPDENRIREILEILALNIKSMERLKSKFKQKDMVDELNKSEMRYMLATGSKLNVNVFTNATKFLKIQNEVCENFDEIETYLDLFEGEYSVVLVDDPVLEEDRVGRAEKIRELAPQAKVIVIVDAEAVKSEYPATLGDGFKFIPFKRGDKDLAEKVRAAI